jgi:hypothetical protein
VGRGDHGLHLVGRQRGQVAVELRAPLADPDRVDDLRAELGMAPLAGCYEEFAAGCTG